MKQTGFGFLLLVFVCAALSGQTIRPVQAGLKVQNPVPVATPGCVPGSGWRWSAGPELPDVARMAEKALEENGIHASVQAEGYGESDSCGSYHPVGVDIKLRFPINKALSKLERDGLEGEAAGILSNLPGITVGTIQAAYEGERAFTIGRLSDREDYQLLEPNTPSLTFVDGWQNLAPAQHPSGRLAYGISYDSWREKTVLFGGDNTGYSRLDDTWEFDGAGWQQVSPVSKPPARVNIDQAMTFDSWRRKTILFGGLGDSTYLDDTWEYNGASWVKVTCTEKPSARDAHTLAFDTHRGKAVLFGGYSFGPVGDTWEYDGQWTQLNLAIHPTARLQHAMVYDERRKVIVLFGGVDDTSVFSDTWEFDGKTWKQITPTSSPPARHNHGMAYDTKRGVVILFGGENSSGGYLNDTWEYDGKNWSQVTAETGPSLRTEAPFVYDRAHDTVFLFGGGVWNGDTMTPFDDTWSFRGFKTLPNGVTEKKVQVVVYDPFYNQSTRVYAYLGYNDHQDITREVAYFFRRVSGDRVRYRVVNTITLDELPRKNDGFVYTPQQYVDVIQGRTAPHTPDGVDYNWIVNDTRLDICGKANRSEIDEVWIYAGPYTGFWESTLVGPDGYWYNSNPVPGPFTCNRLVPIMGFNPERWVSEAVEDFGHRTESAMGKVYNYQWNQNQTRSGFEKFALVDALSPDYTYSGCGNIHYPPNGVRDYDWDNTAQAQTYCEDFHNYPNLNNPTQVLETVTCATWGCGGGITYFGWWYGNLPSAEGCGLDDVENNWWNYIINPQRANNPGVYCSLDRQLYLSLIRR